MLNPSTPFVMHVDFNKRYALLVINLTTFNIEMYRTIENLPFEALN